MLPVGRAILGYVLIAAYMLMTSVSLKLSVKGDSEKIRIGALAMTIIFIFSIIFISNSIFI